MEIVKSNNFLYVAENCDKVIFSRRKRFYKTKRKWYGLHLMSLDTFVDNPSGKIHDQKCKQCLKCENFNNKKCAKCKSNNLE